MKKLFQAILVVAIVAVGSRGISPCLAQGGSGFSVAPTQLNVTISEGGSSVAYVYITSYFDGVLNTNTEGIPFRIEPESIPVSRNDRNQKTKLAILSNSDIKEGEYSGKVTFLADTGGNVLYGIKVDIVIKKVKAEGFLSKVVDNIIGTTTDTTGRKNIFVAVTTAAFLVVLVLIIYFAKKSRQRKT